MTSHICAHIGYREGIVMPYTLDVWVSDMEYGQVMS